MNGPDRRPSLDWRPGRLAVRLATVGILGVLIGIVIGRPELVVAATPCLAALAVAAYRRPPPPTVSAVLSEQRCFESEPVQLQVVVELPRAAGRISVEPTLVGPVALSPAGPLTAFDTQRMVGTWTLRARRWGRWTIGPIEVRVWSEGLARVTTVRVDAGELVVFPPPAQARDLTVPPKLLARIGNHVSRVAGTGTEFATIRRYVPGDVPRRINWPVSTRRGELHVNTYANERAADIVALIDTTTDVGPYGKSSLDNAIRGAAAVAQTYLSYTDRVAMVGFGTHIRWLAPDVGTRQYYRIVETVLSARVDGGFFEPDLARVPRAALPSGALVFVFTPLLEPLVLEAIRDLRERGHPVLVIDVLGVEPTARADSDLGVRIWRLEREVVLHRLRELGVVVVPWDEEAGVVVERVRLEPLLGGR